MKNTLDSEKNNKQNISESVSENTNIDERRAARVYSENIIITYNCVSKDFIYPSSVKKQFSARFDSRPIWEIMEEDGIASESVAEKIHCKIMEIADADVPIAYFEEYFLRNTEQTRKWYCIGFLCPVPGADIYITFTDIDSEVADNRRLMQMAEYDRLTGLLNHDAFCRTVEMLMKNDEEGIGKGEYAMVYFDVLRFKAVNDMFGIAEGDRLLRYIADTITRLGKRGDVLCRHGADRFIIFTHTAGNELQECIEDILNVIKKYDLSFEITCNVGIYVTKDEMLSVDSMIDRAVLAQSVIKGSYTTRYNYYTESLRNAMLSEQEIAGMMSVALAEKHFVAYYQPQYNHSTGTLVGAEALVRWNHPERGLISPGIFIPIFEKNGFITKLDLYVFEEVCSFIRKCMDEGLQVVPISANFSRHDIFQPNFVENLEEIRTKYDVPTEYLRVEITESAIVGGSQLVNDVVKKLHQYGYIVEMDDFGTGYSSLNVLKDIDLDIIKLDMMFLSDKSGNNRGGTIVSSVVRMAKWLGMPVIAEGVETLAQADFLRSIGCDYIQGYLYSKPLQEDAYRELVRSCTIGETASQMKFIDTLNACDFWDPKSQETLIFSNYVGGAAIFEYRNNNIEIMRVNKKYLDEICMNISEKELIATDAMNMFEDSDKQIYLKMLEQAIETGEEQECETWRTFSSSCCGNDKICIRCNVRLIGRSGDTYLFYAMIRNVTAEKEHYTEILDSERRFKMASEQVNIYYWEYTVATREMRPCFRCMRDLGLPALLTNYPDSAIEMGVFPPEVADMYRDWHKQIAEGVKELEAVIPLTADRVPFHVRYTTEFDEKGRPVKAYGSAALVVNND